MHNVDSLLSDLFIMSIYAMIMAYNPECNFFRKKIMLHNISKINSDPEV